MEGGIASDWLLHPSLQGDLRLINCSQSRQQASRTGEWRAPMTQSGLGGSNKIVVAPPPPVIQFIVGQRSGQVAMETTEVQPAGFKESFL